MNISERIQELRKNKNLSQEQLAEILGVSRQAVSKWEGGQSLPEVEKLIAMSALFDVSTDYILKGEDAPIKNNSNDARIASQIVSAVATMLILVAILATFGRVNDADGTIDIYGGLVAESVGIMLMLVSGFLAGRHQMNRQLLTANILLAGILPSLLFSELLLKLDTKLLPELSVKLAAVFLSFYAIICGTAIWLLILRKKREKY